MSLRGTRVYFFSAWGVRIQKKVGNRWSKGFQKDKNRWVKTIKGSIRAINDHFPKQANKQKGEKQGFSKMSCDTFRALLLKVMLKTTLFYAETQCR